MQIDRSGIPMERITTYILGEKPVTENGNKYILVVSYYFTKWTAAFPMRNMEAETVSSIIVEEVSQVWSSSSNPLGLRKTV